MKKIFKHGSTIALIVIVLILIVPSWRVSFQGWFQGLFMGDLEMNAELSYPLSKEVENWSIKTISGNELQFKDFSGKPIILSFWATWCPPCRTELKELKALKNDFNEKVYFVSVTEESLSKIEESNLHENYDFLYSCTRYPSFFNITSYPTLCIIDQKRNLIFQHSGAGGLDNEKNKTFLNDLIENR